MNWPFVIWSLPRSRSNWLQAWLGGPQLVGHDLHLEADSLTDWLDLLWHGRTGTIETGLPEAAPLLRLAMPGAKFVTIRRPIADVLHSLGVLGLGSSRLTQELLRRDAELDSIEHLGATSIPYDSLRDPSCCAWLFEHLTGLHFDFDWWQVVSSRNVQMDVGAGLERQRARSQQTEGLLREISASLLPDVLPDLHLTRVGREPWDSFWLDAQHRVRDDHLNTHSGEFPHRPFSVDCEQFKSLEAAGRLLISCARTNGQLVGYMLWTLGFAPQSSDLPVAYQGPTFVSPGKWGVAEKLYRWSFQALRSLSILDCELSEPAKGRGASLGKHLVRMGATPMKQVYSLHLGTEGEQQGQQQQHLPPPLLSA